MKLHTLLFFLFIVITQVKAQTIEDYRGTNRMHGFRKIADSTIVVQPIYDDVGYEFSDGMISVKKGSLYKGTTEYWGFVDETGKEVVPVKFSWVKDFANGLAPAKIDGKWGYINKVGEYVIQPQYEDADVFVNGRAVVNLNGDVFTIDLKGNKTEAQSEPEVETELIVDETWAPYYRTINEAETAIGVVDQSGNVIVPFEYSEISDLKNGYAVTVRDNKRGYIDSTGKEIVSPRYESAYFFKDGMAGVNYGFGLGRTPERPYVNGKWGFINEQGIEVIPVIYDEVKSFSEGLAPIGISVSSSENVKGVSFHKWGYLDKAGNEVVPYIYDDAGEFSEGLARVGKGAKYGYIDHTGTVIIPFEYDYAFDFRNGQAEVRKNGQTFYIENPGAQPEVTPVSNRVYENLGYGIRFYKDSELMYVLVDSLGNEIGKQRYDYVGPFEEEPLAKVKLNGKYGYIDRYGKLLAPCVYDTGDYFSYDGCLRVQRDGYWGYLDAKGVEIIYPQYDEAEHFEDGKAKVKKEGKKYYIDPNGYKIQK